MNSEVIRFVHFAVGVAAIGGLLFGYDTGVISGSILFIKEQFSLSATMEEIVVSSVLVVAVVGRIEFYADRPVLGRSMCFSLSRQRRTFQGPRGLLNIHGIAKPAYRAFQLLHELATEMLPVEGKHATVDAWLVRGENRTTLVLTNFALPRHPIDTVQVSFTLASAAVSTNASIQRIDLDHANAKRHWEQLGKAEYLNAATIDSLKRYSELQSETLAVEMEGGTLNIAVSMPPQAVAVIHFSHCAR